MTGQELIDKFKSEKNEMRAMVDYIAALETRITKIEAAQATSKRPKKK